MMKMLIPADAEHHRRPRESSDCEEVQAAMSRWAPVASSVEWREDEVDEKLSDGEEKKMFSN